MPLGLLVHGATEDSCAARGIKKKTCVVIALPIIKLYKIHFADMRCRNKSDLRLGPHNERAGDPDGSPPARDVRDHRRCPEASHIHMLNSDSSHQILNNGNTSASKKRDKKEN